jgi:hypothetical protein
MATYHGKFFFVTYKKTESLIEDGYDSTIDTNSNDSYENERKYEIIMTDEIFKIIHDFSKKSDELLSIVTITDVPALFTEKTHQYVFKVYLIAPDKIDEDGELLYNQRQVMIAANNYTDAYISLTEFIKPNEEIAEFIKEETPFRILDDFWEEHIQKLIEDKKE